MVLAKTGKEAAPLPLRRQIAVSEQDSQSYVSVRPVLSCVA